MFKMFKVGELFNIHPTSVYKMKNDKLFASDGKTPVLSNSSVNNGIGGYCGLAPTEQGGMITFSDTTTGADTMFYQSSPFIGYPHVQGMYPYQPDKWDEKCCLYIISCIRKSAGNGWSYAVKFSRALVKELSVELPVVESSDPDHVYTIDDIDWQYMRDRIAELERDRIAELERDRIAELDAYLKATGLDDYELNDEDKVVLSLYKERSASRQFSDFRIGDMFTYMNGDTDLQKEHVNDIGIPIVSSGLENMGIIGKTDIEARILPANTITVDMFGNAFYRDFEYKEVTHARVFTLVPNGFKLNRLTGLYVVSSLSFLAKKFSYSNMCSYTKIADEKITLPVIKSSDPSHTYTVDDIDWGLMERYIRAIEKQTIADVVKFRDRELAVTRQVVGVA